MVLAQLAEAGVPLSELRKPFERYAASGEINTKVADQKAAMEKVADAYPDAPKDTLDGLSIDCRRLLVQRPPVEHRAACCGSTSRRPTPRPAPGAPTRFWP